MADANISIFNDGQHYVTGEFTVVFDRGGEPNGQTNFTIDGVQDLWSIYEDIEDRNTAEAGSKTIPTNEQWAWVEYDEDDADDSDGIAIDADDWDDATFGTYGITGYEAAGFRSVSAMYGYFVNVGDLYNIAENSGTFFPQFSEDDSLYGDRRTNLIYGGDGNDAIYGGDTTKTYWDIDTYNFYVDDFDNDLLLTTTEVTETITFSDGTTIDLVTVEGGNFAGSFESDGADFLFGNDDDDYIVSGGGDTVASGGEGNDYIVVTIGEKDENHLFGGTGNDIFIINADPDSGEEADDEDSVADIIFGDDIGETADTVISALELVGIENPALDILDFSIPIAEGLLNKFVFDVEATSAETSSDLTSTVIYDFDPTEDYLIIYAGDDDTISFDSAGDASGIYEGIAFTNNSGDRVAFITGELFTSSDAADDFSAQFLNDAVFMQKSGDEYFVRQGSRSYDADDLGNSSFFSDLGLEGYGSQLILVGAYGPKNIYGSSDSEFLHGTVAYADVLYGYSYDAVDRDSGNDDLYGYGGDDWLTGGGGDDNLWGGDGTDTAFYLTSGTGISVDLSTLSYDATNDEYYAEANDGNEESSAKIQGLDRLYSIENISGSYYADTIIGDDSDNTLAGLAGNDIMFGGGGTDIVSFVNAESAVTIDLINQSDEDYDSSATYTPNAVTDDGSGDRDFLSGFENITGSGYDDSLTGDDSDNVIEGGDGDDFLKGRGGNDTFYGGTADDDDDTDAGNDTVSYSTASSAVTVDLASGTASDGEGGTDTLYDIDNVIGSDYDDTLMGDDNANTLDGGSGTDTADYSDADGPISILIDGDSGTITVTDSNGVVDTLKNIEHFIGTKSSEDSVELTGDTSIDFFTFENIESISNNSSVETDTTVTVTLSDDEFDGNFADDDISLREALFKVADGGIITFDDALDGSTIELDSELGQLEIDRSVQIDASTLDLTVDAQGNNRVFFVSDESYTVDMKAVVIDGLTITGGSAFGAFLSDRGAGIFNKESLTLTNSTITGNTAETGAGIYNYFDANLTITNSTISNNTAEYSAGGLRDGGDITTITNSTFSGNEVTSTSSSSGDGGAIQMSGSTLTISNSTITGNTTGDDGGGIYRSSGTLTIVSSIVSGNTAGDEGNEIRSSIFGPQAISGGNNLFGDDSQTESEALENVTLDDTDILATSDGDTPTALDEILDTTLGDDGTHALVEGSPAIDAGRNDDGLTTDQRGADRTVDGDGDTVAVIDIGAYEYQGSETLPGTVFNGPVECSEEVINQLSSGDDYLIFSGGDSTQEFNGNGGNDTFFLGEGSQRANLGDGNDIVFAGGGDDLIRDNGGVNNYLFGEEGDDLIVASAGGGVLSGGAGFDIIEINGAQGYTVQFGLDAASGTDTFDRIRNVNEQTLREGLVVFDVLGVDSPMVTFEHLGNGTQVSFNGDNLMVIENLQPVQLESLNSSQSLFI